MIDDDLFTCDTPLGTLFNEFNRLSGMDDDLFTYEVKIPELSYFPSVEQQMDDLDNRILDVYERKLCYDECEKMYVEPIIFVNKRLQFDEYMEIKKEVYGLDSGMKYDPSDVNFGEWLALKFSNYMRMDRIDTDLFHFETPLCEAFNEFNYLLKIDVDVLTNDIPGFKTYDIFKDAWIYEWNKDVPWVANMPWLDYGPWMEPIDDIEHIYLNSKAILDGLKGEDEESCDNTRTHCLPNDEWEDFKRVNHIGAYANSNYNPYLDVSRIFNDHAGTNNHCEIDEEWFDEHELIGDDDDDIGDFEDYLNQRDHPYYVNKEEERSKERIFKRFRIKRLVSVSYFKLLYHRFRRDLDNKLEGGDRMWRSIKKGPYVMPMIPNPDRPTKQILEPLSKMTKGNKKQYITDVRVMNYLLQAIPNDIYNSLDACKNAKDITIRATSSSIQSKESCQDHDPLALLAHSNASSSQSHANPSYSPQPYYVTHPPSVADYEDEYQCKVFQRTNILAMKDEARINLNDEENNFTLNNSYGVETLEKLTTVVIMMARIQSADDNAATKPSYDAKAISEVNASTRIHEQVNHVQRKTIIHTSDDDQIDSNIIFDDPYVENNGCTFEHDSTVHDEYHDIKMLAYNVQRESKNKKRLNNELQNQNKTCEELEREIRADKDTIELSLNEKDKIESDFFKIENEKIIEQHETQLAKKTFKEQENQYLEDICDLKEKLSSHDQIVYKIGLGYKNPEHLKKAITSQSKIYDGEMIHSTCLKIDTTNSEETLEDAKECRLKMRNKMVKLNYEKLNAFYETFVPQQDHYVEQTYFSIPSTSNDCSKTKEVTPDLSNLQMPKESKLLKIFEKIGFAINNLQTRIDVTLLDDRKIRWISDSQNSLREFYKIDVVSMSESLSMTLKELQHELIEKVQEILNIFESMEQKAAKKYPKENVLQIHRLLEVSLTREIRDCVILTVQEQKNEMLRNELEKSSSVESSDSVRRPKSKDNKSKDRVLKNTNDKRSSTHVRIIDLKVKRALFTTLTSIAAKSKNLGDTSVVAKPRLSVVKIPTTTNMVSSVLPLSPDSSQRTVRFGNDHFAAITRYGDCIQGNLTICHVYYVEGLRHNLFLVRQFFDGDLEVAFRSNTCYVWNLKGDDLLTSSQESKLYTISISELAASSRVCLMSKATSKKSWLWHRRLSHLNFADIGIFIGYSESSKGFCIYNHRTKKIMEMIHVKFDELTTMASECNHLEPKLNCSNFQDSSEDSQSVPSKTDLDNLFGLLYEKYYATSPPEVSDNSARNTLDNENASSSSSIVVEEDEAP
uniref:Integrase, catalytic region, zinc finger, CCHC-type, peptidase aspartic, catalytic n=1 Tax=Tanacetum cinerariifolium TaxID=118510 RepID=A0A6L2MV22_TANCI|nr:integrase, catalytic region, zinc finger, CCHC-type, peptidase aspartic, catalytic [Tanacetum cinerariifolium]